jgi:hypothetical protein
MFNTLKYIVLPNGHVRVSVVSHLSRKENTMDLPIGEDRLKEYANDGGKTLIQRLLPELNADQREFLKTGITSKEWDDLFADSE